MNKQKLQTLKGFRDFLPEDAARRNWLRDRMIQVFQSWGYEPLETPTLEPLELFDGQIGEDEKLFFKFKDLGGRDVALRYDQTLPTCRFIGENYNKLAFPFRRYQIQSAYRAEKPQKGRYREFTQSDIDIFGVSSPLADAEIIAVTLDLYRQLGFKKAVAKINNRDLMKNLPYKAIAAIDKIGKIGRDGVIEEIVKKGISNVKANEYLTYVEKLSPDAVVKEIFEYLKGAGFSADWYEFEPTLARAFSYSQGPIWEIVVPGYGAGSVGGGERYDDLVEKISGYKVPGTGIGIGFDRTLEALVELGLMPKLDYQAQVMISVFNEKLMSESVAVAKQIRSEGLSVEIYPDPSVRLANQLKYANKKQVPFVVIIGPDEVKNNMVTLKNMAKETEETLSVEEVMKKLNSPL